MYTTPFASLRVPDIDDTDMSIAALNLATDIQYRSDRHLERITEMRRRRGVGISNFAGTALPNGSVITVPFDSVSWNDDSYFSLASPTVVTLPRGLWYAAVAISFGGSGSLSWSLMDVSGSTYGNIISKQNGLFAASVTSISWLSGAGIFYTNGETISVHVVQNSGGAGSISIASLTVYKIGNL